MVLVWISPVQGDGRWASIDLTVETEQAEYMLRPVDDNFAKALVSASLIFLSLIGCSWLFRTELERVKTFMYNS